MEIRELDPETHMVPLTKLENQLCFPFYAASRVIVQSYTPALDKLGITYPQYLVLMALWEADGLTVSDIGEKLYLDSGTLTPVLKKLNELKFITRKRGKNDDRKVHNYLTVKGKALQKTAAKISFSLLCNSGLTLEEVSSLRGKIKKLLNQLQANAQD